MKIESSIYFRRKIIQLYEYFQPLLQLVGLVNISNFSKRNKIKNIGKQHNIFTVIETGTYLGLSSLYFSRKFKDVHTIELDLKLFLMAKQKLGKYRNIHLELGSSDERLSIILSKIKEPVLFFLDAHASGGITTSGIEPSPIKRELKVIEKFNMITKSVIIIDDAQGFDGTNSYPTFEYVVNWASKLNMSEPIMDNNMIVITPNLTNKLI